MPFYERLNERYRSRDHRASTVIVQGVWWSLMWHV